MNETNVRRRLLVSGFRLEQQLVTASTVVRAALVASMDIYDLLVFLRHTFCGSPLYASPEIVSGIPYYGPEVRACIADERETPLCSVQVDCWSLGVLLYTLVYGSMPFQGGDYNRLVRNITSGEFIQPREQSGNSISL